MNALSLLAELGQAMAQVLLPIFAITAAGFILRRRFTVDVRSVSRIVFYILAPCLIYTSIVNLNTNPDTILRTLAYAALYMVGMVLFSFLLARRSGYDARLGGAFVMTAILINNGNYGLPLNLFAFGQQGFNFAVVLFMFNSLIGSTISIYLLARGQNGSRLALKRTLGTPVIWAIILGLLSRSFDIAPSGSLMEMIELSGRAAIPVFLIVLGMSLAQAKVGDNIRAVTRLTALRMLGGPALAITLAGLVGLSGIAYSVAVMQGSMPTAINSIVISNEFEASPDFVSGAVFATTVVSIFTLPVLLTWLR